MMLDDILNAHCIIEIQDEKYKFEFNHLAYATLEKETGKSIYWFYDEIVSGKNLMYTDLLCFVKVGLLKYHSQNEIEKLIEFLEQNIYYIQNIKDDLVITFITPLIVPDFIKNIKKKLQTKKKNKKLKN